MPLRTGNRVHATLYYRGCDVSAYHCGPGLVPATNDFVLDTGVPRRDQYRWHREQCRSDQDAAGGSDGVHQRIEVIERKKLVAQELQSVKVLGSLGVVDSGDRSLKVDGVGLDLDRLPVTEDVLKPLTEGAQQQTTSCLNIFGTLAQTFWATWTR